MHIFFSGIGGTAIGPLALIAKQAGFEVSGSDKQDSQYIQYLKKHGVMISTSARVMSKSRKLTTRNQLIGTCILPP
jgi:UDP-N-acetylmuramate-alanine ligase